ncbi:hypothetical protein, partial [Clostridium butyricum]
FKIHIYQSFLVIKDRIMLIMSNTTIKISRIEIFLKSISFKVSNTIMIVVRLLFKYFITIYDMI